jgi:hypothetical protein
MIPLNPDSVKWLVTFCFWTLKYRNRDIGLVQPARLMCQAVYHSITGRDTGTFKVDDESCSFEVVFCTSQL